MVFVAVMRHGGLVPRGSTLINQEGRSGVRIEIIALQQATLHRRHDSRSAPVIYTSVASSVIVAAFSTRETGQPTSALCASSSNFALSMPGTFAVVVR